MGAGVAQLGATVAVALRGWVGSAGRSCQAWLRVSAAKEVTPPANANMDPGSFPESVSCTSAGNSTVVGYYVTSGKLKPMVVTETNGHWEQAEELSLPADADAKLFAGPFSVSCSTSSRDCTAVGPYATEGDVWEANDRHRAEGRLGDRARSS